MLKHNWQRQDSGINIQIKFYYIKTKTFTKQKKKDRIYSLVFGLKHIYLSSIAKQALATINHFRVRFLELTSTDVILRNKAVTRRGLEPLIIGLSGRHLNH
jgi:hypothetical protein